MGFFGIESLFFPLANGSYTSQLPPIITILCAPLRKYLWLTDFLVKKKKKKKPHSVRSTNSSSSVCYSLQLSPGLQSPVGFISPPITTRCGLAPWSPCQERAGGQPQLVGKAAHERRNEMKWDKWGREGATQWGCCVDVVKNTSRNNLIGTAELLKIAKSKPGRDERTTALFCTGGQK